MAAILERILGRSGALSARRSPAALIASDAKSAASEAYRALRTNINGADDSPRMILVTSSTMGEGKSITCANLGIVLASTGQRVAIVEADLRQPSQTSIWRWIHANVAAGEAWPQALQALVLEDAQLPAVESLGVEVLPQLTVFAASIVPARPAELLASRRFARFLEALRERYDIVLVDSPPVGLVTDAAVISRLVDGVLLVLDCELPRRRGARRAVRALDQVGAPIIGAVLNRATFAEPTVRYGYGYGTRDGEHP